MATIGRNQACPCGSGKKYKHCCLPAGKVAAPAPQRNIQTPLQAMIAKVQEATSTKNTQFYELGVFLFFIDSVGNAWLLEPTESDALQIAKRGQAIATLVQEDGENITINFTHTFAIRDRKLYLRSYEDQSESVLTEAPTMRISAAIRRLHKNYPQEMLDSLHLNVDAGQVNKV